MNPTIHRTPTAAEVATKWKATYYRDGAGWHYCVGESDKIYCGLVALPIGASPAQIAKVIGNTSWTDLTCDQCKKSVTLLVTVGDERDYESSTADLCKKCITKAFKLMEAS